MKIPATISKWFPANQYEVYQEFDGRTARSIFSGMTSSTWGAGKIGNTGYAKISQLSPEKAGDKTQIIICKNELLGDLLN